MAWKGRKLYEGELWASLGEAIMGIPAEDIESSARTVLRAQERWLKILLGSLHEDNHSTTYVTFKEGQWNLVTVVRTDGGLVHEVLCRHEDFPKFMELVHENSDYVEGE